MIRKSGYRFSEKIMLKHKIERDDDSKKSHRALGIKPTQLFEIILAAAATVAGAFSAALSPLIWSTLAQGSNTSTPASMNSLRLRLTTTKSWNAAMAAMNKSGVPNVWQRFGPSTTVDFIGT